MRRALAIGGIVASSLVTTGIGGCTQSQMDYFLGRQAEVAATPDPQDDVDLMNQYLALPDVPDTPCNEWYWYAIEAGWTHELWMSFVSYVMPRESHCDPGAYNPSGASGLLQVVRMWADDCGGVPSDLFDPLFNLKCGLYVYNVQGPRAWQTWKG